MTLKTCEYDMATPKCSFRIIGLTDDELSHIEKNILQNVNYRTGRSHKDLNAKVLVIPLEENKISSDLLIKLLENCSPTVRHDFIVSIYTDEETFLVDVPRYILDLFLVIKGEICFSYTTRPTQF